MRVNTAAIVSILRSRGLNARADWVARTLPDVVDTKENNSLLTTLHIDPAVLVPARNTPDNA
jgi:hypothetical protein